MNWDHIYGLTPQENNNTYYDTWPIPLVTSRQDLKQKGTHRTLQKRYFQPNKSRVLLLAVHLCGTLSLRAVELFNQNPETIVFMALKPCCLPPMIHTQRNEVFALEGRQQQKHSFAAELVCSNGRFRGNRWHGPPRWHLEHKFQTWAENLFFGVDVDDATDQNEQRETSHDQKARVQVTVQREGGFQNSFIFAQRAPISDKVWKRLSCQEVVSFLEEKDRDSEEVLETN
mmetsp:Transcript_40743/g.84781  ORF Transcript_40743/g.84781 Transcript_40743/m.84781 type:complete len:229 (-) Transcript_40743:19-705(-)